MAPWTLFTTLCVALLVAAERRGPAALRIGAKLAASAGFLAVAWTAGAAGSTYGRAVLGALVLSWVGDACLLSDARRPFLFGLGAFLAAHLAYAAAFVSTGPSARWAMAALLPLAVVAVGVRRWLEPRLDAPMRLPVAAYVIAITAMVALAFGAFGEGARAGIAAIPAGATAFFLSDLAVARQRFVSAGWVNRLWGLPLYYLGQLLLASSVG